MGLGLNNRGKGNGRGSTDTGVIPTDYTGTGLINPAALAQMLAQAGNMASQKRTNRSFQMTQGPQRVAPQSAWNAEVANLMSSPAAVAQAGGQGGVVTPGKTIGQTLLGEKGTAMPQSTLGVTYGSQPTPFSWEAWGNIQAPGISAQVQPGDLGSVNRWLTQAYGGNILPNAGMPPGPMNILGGGGNNERDGKKKGF